MDHINVYVESFTSVLPAREVPIAGDDALGEALATVQDTDNLYRDDEGALTVPSSWHRAAVLDFGDWIEAHVPDFDLYMIAYKFGHMPFVRAWIEYDALELAEEINEVIVENYGQPTPDELAQAQLVAEGLTSTGQPLTISVLCELDGISTLYIPRIATRFDLSSIGAMDFNEMDELDNRETEYLSFFSLTSTIALAALKSQAASIAYVIHDQDEQTEAFGVYLFARGHIASISGEDLSRIVDIHANDGSIFGARLSEHNAKTEFESNVQAAASALAQAVHVGLEIAYEHTTKKRIGEHLDQEGQINLGIIGNVPIILARSLTGEFAGEIGPYTELGESISSVFVKAMESSPFVTPEEATRYAVANEVVRGACEVLLAGNSNNASERVVDLIQQLELGMGDDQMVEEELAVFDAHADMKEQEVILQITDEAYEALPAERKSHLTHLINMLTLDTSELHSIVALEGNLDEPDTPISAKVLAMPPVDMELPADIHDDMRRLLKSIVYDASRSANTTLLCASRVPMSSSVHISGLGFKNGSWSDLGEEKTMFYLNATNVGDPLNLLPTDNIDYRSIY